MTWVAAKAPTCDVLSDATCVVERPAMTVVLSPAICLRLSEEIVKDICQSESTLCPSSTETDIRARMPVRHPHAGHSHSEVNCQSRPRRSTPTTLRNGRKICCGGTFGRHGTKALLTNRALTVATPRQTPHERRTSAVLEAYARPLRPETLAALIGQSQPGVG